MPDESFEVNANIKAAGSSPRAIHKYSSGVDDGVDTTKVRPSDWNAEHQLIDIPTRINSQQQFTLAALATKTWSDSEISRIGSMIVMAIANDAIGIVQYYRAGTFNIVIGVNGGVPTTGGGSALVFRGTTFSAGSNNTGYHFYLSSNNTGATLNLKNTNAFGRTFIVYEWAGDGATAGLIR